MIQYLPSLTSLTNKKKIAYPFHLDICLDPHLYMLLSQFIHIAEILLSVLAHSTIKIQLSNDIQITSSKSLNNAKFKFMSKVFFYSQDYIAKFTIISLSVRLVIRQMLPSHSLHFSINKCCQSLLNQMLSMFVFLYNKAIVHTGKVANMSSDEFVEGIIFI